MKRLITIIFATLAIVSFAQEALPTIKVNAKGDDVRSVLHDLFGQAKKNYVLEPGVRFALYLSLQDVEFEEALQLVCKTASLKYEQQNGIYFVSLTTDKDKARPKVKLPESVLTRTVSTKLDKVDIRALFTEIAKQTKVVIEIEKDIPAYKLDAHLQGASLKYALTTICEAANLKFSFTDNRSILLEKKKDGEGSKVVLKG